MLLETQLDVEKSKVDQEKKKVAMLQDQIRDIVCNVVNQFSLHFTIKANLLIAI